MPANHIKSVPNNDKPDLPARATTSSFRIPVYWFEKVRGEAKRLDISISQVYMRALTNYFQTFDTESWSTVDDPENYNPSYFYTRSQDQKGHSFGIRTNIPKPLAAELSSLVTSRIVPAYRSVGDIVRDALYHRVKQISRMVDSGELEQTVDMAMLLSDEIKISDEVVESTNLIEAVRVNAQMMLSRGQMKQLKRYLASRREMSTSIPEPYRDDYLSAISDFEKRIEKQEKKRNQRRR